MFLTNLLILKLQSYKNNSKAQIKALQSYLRRYDLCQSFLPVRLVPLAKLITLIVNHF